MTAQLQCPVCFEPNRNGLVCRVCIGGLVKDLRELPELMGELTVQFARLSQSGTGNGGRGATTPVPFDQRSTEHRDLIVNTISTWIRDIECGDLYEPGTDQEPLRNSMASWCAWLLERTDRIRMHPEPTHFLGEIHHCVVLARRAIDTPGISLPCGQCPTCGKDVYAPVGAEEGTCRHCSWAGIERRIPVDMSHSTLLDKARDVLRSRKELLDAARVYQVHVNPHTFKSWIRRGQLTPKEVTPDGTPMYRVGDVLDLASHGESAESVGA